MISKTSRYAGGVLYKDAAGDHLGPRREYDKSPRSDDLFHSVVDGDRFDVLAYSYLGDATLWWIIADYNDIFFPLELETNTVLRIPSYSKLLQILR